MKVDMKKIEAAGSGLLIIADLVPKLFNAFKELKKTKNPKENNDAKSEEKS